MIGGGRETYRKHSHPSKRLKAITAWPKSSKAQLNTGSAWLCCLAWVTPGSSDTQTFDFPHSMGTKPIGRTGNCLLFNKEARSGGPYPISNFDLNGQTCLRLPKPTPPWVFMNPSTEPQHTTCPKALCLFFDVTSKTLTWEYSEQKSIKQEPFTPLHAFPTRNNFSPVPNQHPKHFSLSSGDTLVSSCV